jgi:hypothetical protein
MRVQREKPRNVWFLPLRVEFFEEKLEREACVVIVVFDAAVYFIVQYEPSSPCYFRHITLLLVESYPFLTTSPLPLQNSNLFKRAHIPSPC